MKIKKSDVVKVIKSSSTLSEAAEMLGINRRTLYNIRKEHKLPIAVRG